MYSNIAAQTAFLTDMAWVISRYPDLVGYVMEEPHRYGTDGATAAAVRAGYNLFLRNAKHLFLQVKYGGSILHHLIQSIY